MNSASSVKYQVSSVRLLRFVICFLLLDACGLTLDAAFGAEVEPHRLELTIPTDQPTQGKLAVTNASPRSVSIRVQADSYRFLGEKPAVPSAQGWFSFEPQTLLLAAGATSEVAFHITPPANVMSDPAGEYVAAILVDELPAAPDEHPGAQGQSHITIVPRFALPVYLILEGRELVKVEFPELSVKLVQSRLEEKAPFLIRFEAVLKNEGSIHVRPIGTISILHEDGQPYQSASLGKSLPILPGEKLRIPALIPLPPVGRYKAVVTITPNPGEILQKEIPFEVTPEREVR